MQFTFTLKEYKDSQSGKIKLPKTPFKLYLPPFEMVPVPPKPSTPLAIEVGGLTQTLFKDALGKVGIELQCQFFDGGPVTKFKASASSQDGHFLLSEPKQIVENYNYVQCTLQFARSDFVGLKYEFGLVDGKVKSTKLEFSFKDGKLSSLDNAVAMTPTKREYKFAGKISPSAANTTAQVWLQNSFFSNDG